MRQFSAFWAWTYVLELYGAAVEGVKGERERDTWLGLIATPLTGWEILRAKMLGPVSRGRGGALAMIGLWTVGLIAGAVHPLGFLAAVTGLAVSAWFYAAIGVSSALRPGGMERVLVPSAWVKEIVPGRSRGDWLYGYERAGHPLTLPVRLVAALGVILLLVASPVALAWLSLLSYEDVFSVVHSGAFPQFGATAFQTVVGVPDDLPLVIRHPASPLIRVMLFGTGSLQTVVGARTVVGVWLAGTTALGAGAYSMTRAMCRDFDVAVGRPTRPRSDAPAAPDLGRLAGPACCWRRVSSPRDERQRLASRTSERSYFRVDRSQDWIPAVREVDYP